MLNLGRLSGARDRHHGVGDAADAVGEPVIVHPDVAGVEARGVEPEAPVVVAVAAGAAARRDAGA